MISTSVLLGHYMLTLKAQPNDRVQLLLTDGRTLLSESWVDKDELRQIVDPVITKEL